jgi:hypothetical protein
LATRDENKPFLFDEHRFFKGIVDGSTSEIKDCEGRKIEDDDDNVGGGGGGAG